MRKRFWLVVLVPLIVFLIIVYLFHNRWIESGLEYAAEEVVGAKVEIDNLHLSLLPLGIVWSKMQVANPNDPWKNLFETGTVKFSMDFNQILRGKYIIDLVEVDDLTVDTKRTTEGSIDPERKKRAILGGDKITFSKLANDALQNMVTTTPLFDIAKLKNGFNADSLVKALDMKTVKHIDTLKNQINGLTDQWASLQKDFEAQKQKAVDLGKQISAINPSELNNVQNITSAILLTDNAIKTVNEITAAVDNRSKSVQTDIQNFTTSVGLIDNYVKDDFSKLKNMARLPSLNTNGMAQLLVGTEMYKRAKNYLRFADEARASIQKYSPQPEENPDPPRMKGQDIKFPTDRSYPKLWIKKIVITGGSASSDYIRAQGNAFNISDNQKVTGMPLTVNLEGTGKGNRTLKLSGLFDRRSDIPLDEFTASISSVPVGEFALGKADFLPTKVTNALMNTELKISVPGNKFDATAKFNLKNISLHFDAAPKNLVEELVHKMLMGIKDFNVNLRLWNTDSRFDIALATDLDEKLSQSISAVLGEEFSKLQNELRQKFDAAVQVELQKFDKMYKAKLAEVQNQINSYQTLFADKLNIVENKKAELTAQLEKQKQGFLEDKLKGLFKK